MASDGRFEKSSRGIPTAFRHGRGLSDQERAGLLSDIAAIESALAQKASIGGEIGEAVTFLRQGLAKKSDEPEISLAFYAEALEGCSAHALSAVRKMLAKGAHPTIKPPFMPKASELAQAVRAEESKLRGRVREMRALLALPVEPAPIRNPITPEELQAKTRLATQRRQESTETYATPDLSGKDSLDTDTEDARAARVAGWMKELGVSMDDITPKSEAEITKQESAG